MFRFSSRITTGIAFVAISAPVAFHVVNGDGGKPGPSAVVRGAGSGYRDETPPRPPEKTTKTDTPAVPVDPETLGRTNGYAELQGKVCDFLVEYTGKMPGDRNKTCTKAADGRWRVAIAILPDPVHTHLALRFDRAIDDIEDAVQDLGWTFDHSWLPWDNKTHTESDRYEERLSDVKEQHGWEDNNPGVLLFRGNEGKNPKPLIVLVVGDTPTRGVNPKQFRAALAMWKLLTRTSAVTASGQDLSILGPDFSGSIQSLGHLLQEIPCDSTFPSEISAVSGSVTSGPQLKWLAGLSLCGRQVYTASFAMDIEYEHAKLIEFLGEHENNDGNILELKEAESTFGDFKFGNSNVEDLKELMKNDQVRVLHFPREISRLRMAYEQNSIVGFGKSSNAPQTQLRFSMGADTHDDDTVAQFSGQQQTLAMETEMAQIATKIDKGNFSIVLVSATDALDEIFVARYLQQHAPAVTVVIQDTDLLFLRKGDDAGLDNTYVASPWPLIADNQNWSAPDKDFRTPHLFQSEGDEGLHDAAISLLGNGQPDPETGEIRFGANGIKMLEYRPPFGTNTAPLRPPLWLSVIGHGSFSPIALIDVDHPKNDLSGTNLPILSQLHGPATGTAGIQLSETPLATRLVTALIALLLLWHGAACIRSRLDRRFGWTYALADEEHRVPRLWLQAGISFLAVPALELLWVPSSPQLVLHTLTFQHCVIVIQVVAMGLVLWPIFRILAGIEWPRTCRERIELACGMLAAVAFLFVCTWVVDHSTWDVISPAKEMATERLFFLYRSSLLLCGSSPALTILLLLAACACWLHSHFGRLAFFGHRIPQMPANHDEVHCPSPKRLEPVTDLLCNFKGWNLGLLVVVIAGVATILAISGSAGPQSLAHGNFDSSVRWLTFVVTVMILHNVLVAVCGWRFLRQHCLLPLKQSPLRWGFNWIKGFSWHKIWTSYRSLSPEVMFDYMLQLDNANNRARGNNGLDGAYKALRARFYGDQKKQDYKTFREWLRRDRKNEAWAIAVADQILKVHEVLAHVASEKLDRLMKEWANDHGAITGPDKERGMFLEEPIDEDLKNDEGKETGKRTTALDRMADEEFVALLYLGYIRMVLIQIRNRIMTSSVLYVLLLWAMTSYPWMNRHAIFVYLSLLLGLISVAAIYIYSEMHRDDILSRTTETTSGKLDTEFFAKIVPTIGIPLLTLIASQFPEFSSLIFSWLEPSLRGQ